MNSITKQIPEERQINAPQIINLNSKRTVNDTVYIQHTTSKPCSNALSAVLQCTTSNKC